MNLARITQAVRASRGLGATAALLQSPVRTTRISTRTLSTTSPRRIAMADGGKAADDIELAFDYPSEMQATYTTPSGVHQTRLDKEMGYPDQTLLYAIVGILGCAGLYGAVKSNVSGEQRTSMTGMPASATDARVGYDAQVGGYAVEQQQRDTGVHLPSRKPSESRMERFIGRGG